jgi:hypothetical protein
MRRSSMVSATAQNGGAGEFDGRASPESSRSRAKELGSRCLLVSSNYKETEEASEQVSTAAARGEDVVQRHFGDALREMKGDRPQGRRNRVEQLPYLSTNPFVRFSSAERR